jgi:hypothetical protein
VLDDELRKRAHEWAEQSAIAQGLPPKVEDPLILRRIALLLGLEGAKPPKLE